MADAVEKFQDTVHADDLWAAEHELLARVYRRANDIARGIVETYRREVLDYKDLSAVTLLEDVLPTGMLLLEDLLQQLERHAQPSVRAVNDVCRSAARRVHQEVSLPSLLHTYRIWGAAVWHEIATEADKDPALRDAALRLVAPLMAYVDQISIYVAQVYLEESTGLVRGHDIVRSDLLESLLHGRALSDRARLDIVKLKISDELPLAVLLIRLLDVPADRFRISTIRAVQALREQLVGTANSVIGVRDSDVLAIAEVSSDRTMHNLAAIGDVIAGLDVSWRVAIGRPHQGLQGLPRAFREARDAATLASATDQHGTVTLFSEVMLDRILLESEYCADLLADTILPLVEYDRRHSSGMVTTLAAYLKCNFNVARTAKLVTASPNTVSYRLGRIAEISGHDPTTAEGATTLAMALRLLRQS